MKNKLLGIASILGVIQFVCNFIGERQEQKNEEKEREATIRRIVKEELKK